MRNCAATAVNALSVIMDMEIRLQNQNHYAIRAGFGSPQWPRRRTRTEQSLSDRSQLIPYRPLAFLIAHLRGAASRG